MADHQTLVEYATATIAQPQPTGKLFSIEDFVQDIDGYNIAHSFLTSNTRTLADCVKDALATEFAPGKDRYDTFWRNRLSMDVTAAETCAMDVFGAPASSDFGGFSPPEVDF